MKTEGLYIVWIVTDHLDWAVHPRGENQLVIVQTYLEIDGYARKVPPVSFRPRTNLYGLCV